MSKQDPDGRGWVAQEGVGANAGASVDPCALPEDDAPAERTTPRAAPLGHPISPEEYRRLKERAKTSPVPVPASLPSTCTTSTRWWLRTATAT